MEASHDTVNTLPEIGGVNQATQKSSLQTEPDISQRKMQPSSKVPQGITVSTAKDLRAMKSMNSNKKKVRQRVGFFIDTLDLAAKEIVKEGNSRKNLTTAI